MEEEEVHEFENSGPL
ncbi:hypothetical protein LINPERPRIM_LOCUS26219 [Linum perenne]